jgi:hypothetical protein
MCIAPTCCTRLLKTLDGFFAVWGGVIGEGIATQAAGQLDGGLLEQRVQGLRLLGGHTAGGPVHGVNARGSGACDRRRGVHRRRRYRRFPGSGGEHPIGLSHPGDCGAWAGFYHGVFLVGGRLQNTGIGGWGNLGCSRLLRDPIVGAGLPVMTMSVQLISWRMSPRR